MITEESKKRLFIGALIGGVIFGILFLVWAVFLNRGTLTINAKAPYFLSIQNIKDVSCITDICSTVIAPGRYTLQLKKVGYKDETRQIEIPFHGEYQEDINFQFLPIISQKGERKLFYFPGDLSEINLPHFPELAQKIGQNLTAISLLFSKSEPQRLLNMPIDALSIHNIIFAPDGLTAIVYEKTKVSLYDMVSDTITPIDIPVSSTVFYDATGRYMAYIKRNKENFRQTLYLQHLDASNHAEEPVLVTSFIRDVQNPLISIAPSHQKILLVDQNNLQSSLYLIDLVGKNRINILTYPIIRAIKWLKEGGDFLFEGRAENSISDSIFLFRAQEQKVTELELKTSLQDVAVLDQNNLVVATIQKIPGAEQPQALEGKVITLGERQSSPEPTGDQPLPTTVDEIMVQDGSTQSSAEIQPTGVVVAFLEYSLEANQGRLIKVLSESVLPDAVELSEDGKTLYFLQGNMLSTLRFKE